MRPDRGDDVEHDEGAALAGEPGDGLGIVADTARSLDVDKAHHRDLGMGPKRSLDLLRLDSLARLGLDPDDRRSRFAKPTPDRGTVWARGEVERDHADPADCARSRFEREDCLALGQDDIKAGLEQRGDGGLEPLETGG